MLARIEACLSSRNGPALGRVFCVHGLPGIGKTHTAIEFAYSQQNQFTHIFWISADSEEKLEHGYVNIANELGLSNSTATEDRDKLMSLALSWMKKPHQGASWLLVLDNVDNFRVLNRYWPGFAGGAVLITSRDAMQSLTAVATSASDSARVEAFSGPEGTELIRRRFGEQGYAGIDEIIAAKLAKRFGLYPLYMDQVASFIESDPIPLSEWQERLNLEFGDQDLQNIDPDSPWYKDSVAKAIETHVTRLEPHNRLVLGAAIAFFDPDDIPERLLLSQDVRIASLSNPIKRRTMLARLSKSSFIKVSLRRARGSDGRQISLHRLVRDSAIRSCPDIQTAFDNAVLLLRQAFPLHQLSRDHMVEDWEDCETFQPHVLALHQQYIDLKSNQVQVAPSFEFIELIYSCAW